MNNFNSLSTKCEYSRNSRLYEFLATSYDINNLANKISATKNESWNILSLKKRVSGNDIATA